MMTLFLLIILVCLLFAATAQAGPAGVYSLKTGKLTVGFDIAGNNISLTELSGIDGRNWITKPADGPQWRINYSGPDGAVEEIDSTQAEPIGVAHSANGLQFVWEVGLGTEDREVEINIEARKGSPISHWSLKAELPDGWKVTRCDFPILPDISLDAAKKMAVPLGWGLEYDVKPAMSYEATYPSMLCAMQFLAFYGTGKALYIGTHDPQANHKVFSAKADADGATFTCATTAWQDKVASLTDRLTHECGVDGVYIDQIGCAWAYRCYDKSHSHPLGGGHFWVDGYRKLLDKARAKLPPGKMFTTEENIECWLDQFDALLLVNTPAATDKAVIPLFPAVYSGRTITFGFQYIGKDDIAQSTPFRAKMAREFMGPFGGDYTLDMPVICASAWRAEDGSVGVALANMSDEDRKVEFTAPLVAGKAYRVEEFGPEGRISTGRASSDARKVTVPARSAVIIAFKSEAHR